MLSKWLAGFFPSKIPDELVAIDLETSSLDPRAARILSIGAVRVAKRRVLIGEALHCHILTRAEDVHETAVIHGIRGIDVEQGLPIKEALNAFREFIGERPLLGYHHSFDRRVLNLALQRNALPELNNPAIELAALYQRHWQKRHPITPPNLAFEQICQQFNIEPIGRHTALGDAVTTAICYLALTHQP